MSKRSLTPLKSRSSTQPVRLTPGQCTCRKLQRILASGIFLSTRRCTMTYFVLSLQAKLGLKL